ncbi:outer membrane protein assembly factor BamE [Abyssibacter profundi]|nr:outer membrane protein assembly factor BamE [Abyssibacter profundi]
MKSKRAVVQERMISVLMFSLVLAGCVAAGGSAQIKPDDVATLKEGVTTLSEVRAMFGDPIQTGLTSDGHREFYYQHSKTVVNPATYIPFVGSFLGNSDTDFQKLTIIFDENDVVEHFLYDETSQETKTPLGF